MCLSACLFVCGQDISKIYERIIINFSGEMGRGRRKNELDFDGDR